MPTNYSSLTATLKVAISGSAVVDVTGNDYKDPTVPLSITKSVGPFLSSNGNTAALGADELVSYIQNVTNGTPVSVSLQSLTDLLLRTGISFARVKGYIIRLLSTADDSTNGTACSGITINGAGTNLTTLPGIASSITLGNGEYISWATPNATGTTVSGTTNTIYIANNDAAHIAAVQITVIGGTT